LVLSARLHGCIFSALLGTPFVGISAHDKVKSFFEDLEWDNWADYYGLTQKSIQLAVEQMPSAAAMQSTRERGFERWQELSVIVRERLSL
jgi:polysaccharide pyruvyl transferase WcaK-like protein